MLRPPRFLCLLALASAVLPACSGHEAPGGGEPGAPVGEASLADHGQASPADHGALRGPRAASLAERGRPSFAAREQARRDWLRRQRAYPAADVPLAAFAAARDRWQVLEQASALLPAGEPAGPAPGGPGERTPGPPGPPMPGAPTWALIGPGPLDLSKGPYSTPNMGPTGGRASAIAVDPVHPATLYAGYALGGVWKSTDAGLHWAPLMDDQPSLAIGSIAVDPKHPDTVYVGTGEDAVYAGYYGHGLVKSTDGGATFAPVGGAQFDGLALSRIVIDPASGDLYVAAMFGSGGRGEGCTNTYTGDVGQGLYLSTDGGAAWTRLLAGAMVDLDVDLTVTPRRLFAAEYYAGVHRSDDGGASWHAPAGLPAGSTMEIAVAPSDGAVVYAGVGAQAGAQLWLSTDGGHSFAQIPGAPNYCETQCDYDDAVTVDALDPGTVYLGGSLCGIWKGTAAHTAAPVWSNVSLPNHDCGAQDANWPLGFVHPDVHAIVADPTNPKQLYAASDGGLVGSPDAGATWQRLTQGVATVQLYGLCVDPADPNLAYGGAQDNGTFQRTGAAPAAWQDLVTGDGGPCAVDPKDPRTVLVSGSGAYVAATTDRFRNTFDFVFNSYPGQCQKSDPGCGDRSSFVVPLVGDPSTAGTFYVGTTRLWKTDGGGKAGSWKPISGDLTGGAGAVHCTAANYPPLDDLLTAIAVAPGAPQTLVTGSQGGLISVTTDGGAHWARAGKAPLPARWISGLAVDATSPTTFYAGFSGFDVTTPQQPGHVFVSRDAGGTWAQADIGIDLPVDALVAHPYARGLLYAGTDLGVLVSTDAGKSWRTLGKGLPHAPVNALAFRRDRRSLAAGTYGRSAWELTFGPPAAAVSPATLAFAAQVGGGNPPGQTLSVSDLETLGSVAQVTVHADAPWLSVTPGAALAAGASPTPLAVTALALPAAGTYHASIVVTPAAGTPGKPITVPVTYTVTPPPPPATSSTPPVALPPPTPLAKSGCGCRLDAGGAPRAPLALGALALGGLLLRRRRPGPTRPG